MSALPRSGLVQNRLCRSRHNRFSVGIRNSHDKSQQSGPQKGDRIKIVIIIARILLGLIFVFFGSNPFLHFLPTPPMPPTLVGQFLNSLTESHYVLVVSVAQVAGGLLLFVNRYVPLALAILGPVIVNIISYHVFMSKAGIPLAILVALLWGFLFYANRRHFSSLFAQRSQPN